MGSNSGFKGLMTVFHFKLITYGAEHLISTAPLLVSRRPAKNCLRF